MKTPEELIANSNFADEKFLTRDDICELLKISKKTLWRWHREAKAPPFVRIAGCVRYPEKFLNKWLEERVES